MSKDAKAEAAAAKEAADKKKAAEMKAKADAAAKDAADKKKAAEAVAKKAADDAERAKQKAAAEAAKAQRAVEKEKERVTKQAEKDAAKAKIVAERTAKKAAREAEREAKRNAPRTPRPPKPWEDLEPGAMQKSPRAPSVAHDTLEMIRENKGATLEDLQNKIGEKHPIRPLLRWMNRELGYGFVMTKTTGKIQALAPNLIVPEKKTAAA